MTEEAKRCPTLMTASKRPVHARWQRTHVTAMKPHSPSTLGGIGRARLTDQIPGVVQAIDAIAGVGQQRGVPALSARDIEDPRANRYTQDLDEPPDLPARRPLPKHRLVLDEVMGIEIRDPPLGPGRREPANARSSDERGSVQKKTGSRYAPKTDSIAARIS